MTSKQEQVRISGSAPSQPSRGTGVPVLSAIIVCGLLPVLAYWVFVGRTPSVSGESARALLEEQGTPWVLVDIRDPALFRQAHLKGALNWPYGEIMSSRSSVELPAALQGRKPVLICQSGITSAVAARHLQSLGLGDVTHVRGGMEAWAASAESVSCQGAYRRMETESGDVWPFPYRGTSSFEQWTACVAAFGVKPLYMLISLLLILCLRRLHSPDLRALWWGLVSFLAGETFCALNYLLFGEDSALVEYLHIYGMVLAFGFSVYALLEGLDMRVVHFRDHGKRCAMTELCGTCIKHCDDVRCGMRRVMLVLLPLMIIFSLMPLAASTRAVAYDTEILGSMYHYSHPIVFQIFEIRVAPVAGIVFFLSSLLLLWLKEPFPFPLARILLAGGAGYLGFSMFRLVLFHVYQNNLVWYVVWEEITELLYVAGVALLLLLFRTPLTRKAPSPRTRDAQDSVVEPGRSGAYGLSLSRSPADRVLFGFGRAAGS